MVPNRTCGRRSGTFPDPGHIPAAAPVALWSQYSSFFWTNKSRPIYMVSPACSKVTMSPNSIGGDTLTGHNMTARIALAAAKSGRPISAHRRRLGVAAIVLAPAIMFFSHCALADESGISFWVPGFFGSLAATPQQPGWSLANIYYHTSVSAGADVARAREFTLGRVPANVTVNANLNLNVNATGNLGFVIPSYVFATPVLGGQASVSLMAAYGVVGTSLAGTLSGVVTGPFGNSVPFARSDTISDTTWGFGDLIPIFHCAGTPASTTT